jgi:DNA helicase II / ATP-dependent DNA helicase PcrA
MPISTHLLHEKFAAAYEQLNQQQRIAVNALEGPVMVIAGPGTGKTQILTSRIAKILLETDAKPENILCLTYTDAGVVAMRKRLLQFIGADAYKVQLYTFHAFCNDVIQDNLSLFEKTVLDPISDIECIELFKELIDNFPKNHLLKRYRGDVYFEINNLQYLFSTMKREGWTPHFIEEKINSYIKDLPFRDEFLYKKKYKLFNAGDVKQEKLDAEKEKMEKLRSAVQTFNTYQQLMRRHHRYDFDDMINWVIKAFEENKPLLASYQEKFLYFLVDEYQDTSGTQNNLVQCLINYWSSPNVFVVGDDDQSIYRFQGANVENMLNFAATYRKDLLTVVLTLNYRSTQPILDIAKTLINHNQERLVRQIKGLSKDLVAANTSLAALQQTPPLIAAYESQRVEMMGTAEQIQQLITQNVPPESIAVIYKENKYGYALADYCKCLHIPVYSKRHLNVLTIPLAQQILLILKYIAAEYDTPFGGDEMLFELLHASWFNIPSIEIAKLSIAAAENRSVNNGKTWLRKTLHEKTTAPPKDLFTPTIHPALQKASIVIEQLIADAANCTLQNLFLNVIEQTGILAYTINSAEKTWYLQILTALLDFIKEETHRQPTLRLPALMATIATMEKESLPLPLVQVTGSSKGVHLLTAHGSKGLEFEYVFLVGTNANYWEKKRKPNSGYALPDTLFSSTTNTPTNTTEEELRRLFYVALTRAKQYLHISYAHSTNEGKALEPSMFIAEILEQHPLPIQQKILPPSTIEKFSLLPFLPTAAPEIKALEADFALPRLEKFVMNVTALNNYLQCPLAFYFKNLLQIPSAKNEATEFGSAVHYALEQLFRKMQEESNGSSFPPVNIFIQDFEWYMHRHRESFTQAQFNRRLEYGQEVLLHYYSTYQHQWNKIVAIERNIKSVLSNKVPIKGKLDKLEFVGKEVNIVDYKTGDPEKAKERLQAPNEKNLLGGDYWRQAVFYKILVDNYTLKNWEVVSTAFDFIEPDKKKKYRIEKLTITPEHISMVTQQITTVWQKIQAQDFYTGCGKENCHWCNFVKTNQLAVAWHEVKVE